jgi:hypothetical protein
MKRCRAILYIFFILSCLFVIRLSLFLRFYDAKVFLWHRIASHPNDENCFNHLLSQIISSHLISSSLFRCPKHKLKLSSKREEETCLLHFDASSADMHILPKRSETNENEESCCLSLSLSITPAVCVGVHKSKHDYN